MKTAYDAYSHLWSPGAVPSAVKTILSQVYVLRFPDEVELMGTVDKKKTIAILTKPTVYNAVKFLDLGFMHCLSEERADFTKELLTAALMMLRRQVIADNEIPFFFKNYFSAEEVKQHGERFFFYGTSSREKEKLLAGFEDYLDANPKMSIVKEIALEIADELYTNAIFNGGVAKSGVRKIVAVDRTSDVKLGMGSPVQFFAAHDNATLILGCIDPYGILDKEKLTKHLCKVYSLNTAEPNLGDGGAGLGLKFVIDNSASVYIFCEANSRTSISCGLLLKGMKPNLAPNKHLHIDAN